MAASMQSGLSGELEQEQEDLSVENCSSAYVAEASGLSEASNGLTIGFSFSTGKFPEQSAIIIRAFGKFSDFWFLADKMSSGVLNRASIIALSSLLDC